MSRLAGPSGHGFTVSHQKIALEISFQGSTVLGGYTELTIIPTDKALRTVYLNARQCRISSVTCGGESAQFSVQDHMTGAGISDHRDVHLFPELKRKLFAAAQDGLGGELSIILPQSSLPEGSSRAADSATDAEAAASAPTPSSNADTDLSPITIRIEYSISDPVDAIQRVHSSSDVPWRYEQIYTSPTCPDYARCWVPCVDSLWERCTWELQLVTPRFLQTGDDSKENLLGQSSHKATEIMVVASGDLVDKVIHPHNSSKLIFNFLQAAPTSAHHVGFVAGCLRALDLAAPKDLVESSTAQGATTTQQPDEEISILTFAPFGREDEAKSSTTVVRKALEFFSREYGSYPFQSFKVVFVDDPVFEAHNLATLAVLPSDLLHPATVIDQALETRQALIHAVACQWVGINIIQRAWSDTWLINGLSLYISGLFWRRLMGNNEYRFRLRKDCDRLCGWDIGMPPISQVGSIESPDAAQLPFINLKAPLVLHILDRRLRKAGATVGLGRVIPRVFLQAITGELTNNMLSTSSFLRTCRKVSGIDLRTFADQWIYGSGCPRFYVASNFNRKKMTIEISVRQESPSYQFAEYRPELAVGSNPVKTFEGQMTVRIHEADGRPYEHVLDIKSAQKRFDVPFNTKYKRVRRNTKRFQARQAAAAAAAEGDQDAAEAMGLIDLGFSLAMWEDEEQRERWKVADWTEEDEDIMSQAAYEWIRMDSEFEWLASVQVDQPDYMWVSQLQRDRDVVAQLQAVQALAQMPNAISSSMLTRTVLVQKYFFRIRSEAAHAIVNCAIPQLGYLGLFHLLMLFRTSFCVDVPEQQQLDDLLNLLCIPKANDFDDPAEYFIKRALVHAISRVRNERGRTLPHVKRFLINLLRYNDNSTNRWVDDFYIATIIAALGNAFVPIDVPAFGGYVPANEDPDAKDDSSLFHHACVELSRLQELDKLVPSYHNVVSLACLEWQTAMILSGHLPLDLQHFLGYSQEGAYTPIRIAAFNSLLILSGLKHRVIVRYLFAVLRSDGNPTVKRALAKGICEALAIAIATNDAPGGRQGSLLEEGVSDPSAIDHAKEKEMENALRSLRREVGRSAAVREGFLGALLAPSVDFDERWALLKLAELLFKPAEEKDLPIKPKIPVSRRAVNNVAQADLSSGDTGASTVAKIRLVHRPSMSVDERSDSSLQTARVAFEAPETPSKKGAATKTKKPKPLAQAQAAGMSTTDLAACRSALKKIQTNRHAPLFVNPVDPVRDGAPDYHRIIQDPMDLSTMENKLEAGMYVDRFAFEQDFELLVKNAKTYTPDSRAFVHKEADALERAFKTLWARTNKTLEQTAAKQARAADEQSESPAPGSAAAPAATPMAPPPLPIRMPSMKQTPQPSAPSPSTPSAASAKPLSLKLKVKPRASVGVEAVGSPSTPASTSDVRAASPAPPISTPTKRNVPEVASASAESIEDFAPSAEDGPDPVAVAGNEPIHAKQCKALLQTMKKLPEAVLFLQPVEETYAPGYFSVVHNPMDLFTLEEKLNAGRYPTMSSFASDMEQIFTNAYIYADLTAVQHARTMRRWFRNKEWPKAMVRKLEYAEKRSIQGVLSRIKNEPSGSASLFLQPVADIVKVLPHYFNVVPQSSARDLMMIGEKLKNDKYTSAPEVKEDVSLMVGNAKMFNAANVAILEVVERFEKAFDKEWKNAGLAFGQGRGTSNSNGSIVPKKRGSEEGSGSGGAGSSGTGGGGGGGGKKQKA